MSEDIKIRAENDKIKTASEGTRVKKSRSKHVSVVKSGDKLYENGQSLNVENDELQWDLTDSPSGTTSLPVDAANDRFNMESRSQSKSVAPPFRRASSFRISAIPEINATVDSKQIKKYTVKSVLKSSRNDTRKNKTSDVSADTSTQSSKPAQNPLKSGSWDRSDNKEHVIKNKKRVAVKSVGVVLNIAGNLSYVAGGVVGAISMTNKAESIYAEDISVDEYGEKRISNATVSATNKAVNISIKTIDQAAKTTIKTAKKMIKTSKSTVKATTETAKATVKTVARDTAKATAKTAQASAKITAKAAAAAAKTAEAISAAASKTVAEISAALTEFIAAGGWVIILAVVAVILVVTILVLIISVLHNDLSSPYDWMTNLEDSMYEIATEYDDYLVYMAGGEDIFYTYTMIDYGDIEKPVWIDQEFGIYDTIWPEVTALYSARMWNFGNGFRVQDDVDFASLRDCFSAMFENIDCWTEERENDDGSVVMCLCYDFSYRTFEAAAESLGLDEEQLQFAETLYCDEWISSVNEYAPRRI